MIGFSSPVLELELAKTVRADDLAAAKQFRLARTAKRGRASARSTNLGSLASTARPARPAAGTIGAPRRSSG
jgi:hypothetical protein